MNTFKKILKITALVLALLVVGVSIFLYQSGPALSKGSDEVIEQVMSDPMPNILFGKTGIAKSQGLDIWYESMKPEGTLKGSVLLIMGISNDALGWPPGFIHALVDSGYQVIIYDHRGCGLSDWVDHWDSDHPYTLADMASDAIAVLDTLGIQKAHIFGISMGGMIAQELVILHPDRALSLTSMMSSGNIMDPELPSISSEVAWELIKVALKYGIPGGEKNMVKLQVASRIILRGNATYDVDVKEIAEQTLYNLRMRKGYNINVSKQHNAAVLASGSRYEQLKQLNMATLVMHGKSDPFIPIEHGKKCVAVIPNADSLWIDGLAHDIPKEFVKQVVGKMVANFNKSENQ